MELLSPKKENKSDLIDIGWWPDVHRVHWGLKKKNGTQNSAWGISIRQHEDSLNSKEY
jgi:hypothetical protein